MWVWCGGRVERRLCVCLAKEGGREGGWDEMSGRRGVMYEGVR